MTAGRIAKGLACFAVLLGAASGATLAQQKTGKTPQPPAKQQQAPQQQAPQQAQQQRGPAVPNDKSLNLYIRTTIIALNQANITGNYSVLLELGAPGFRAGQDSNSLTQIFTSLRQRRLDLSPILFYNPILSAPAAINERGLLRLTGFFATTPEQVNFDLTFQEVKGDWRLYGIGVNTSPAQMAATAQALPQNGQGQPPQGQPQAAQAQPAQAAQNTAATGTTGPGVDQPKQAGNAPAAK